MFWGKKRGEEKGKQKKIVWVKEIPGSPLWSYLSKEHGLKGEVLAKLKRAEFDGVVEDKPVTMVRIFDPATASEKGVAVDDYHSLDNHPGLILYEGHYCATPVRGILTDVHIEKK